MKKMPKGRGKAKEELGGDAAAGIWKIKIRIQRHILVKAKILTSWSLRGYDVQTQTIRNKYILDI